MGSPKIRAFLKAIRIHQWAKNLLVFVPLVLAHKVLEPGLAWKAVVAFAAFSLCASGSYIINDLVDLEADRLHPHKRHRPFASGDLYHGIGNVLVPLLLAVSLGFSLQLPRDFLFLLSLYFFTTMAYSFYFKKVPLMDVMVLAALYTIRIFAGATAVQVPISPWLLAFSMFLFLSLAFVKRFSELQLMHVQDSEYGHGRGYMGKDLGLIESMGTASGYVSVMVMALYVNSLESAGLYRHHQILWLICPLLLYWISRVWLLTRRGRMHTDPVVFALKDKVSYVVGLMAFLVILAAK